MGFKITLNAINSTFAGVDESGFKMDITNYTSGSYTMTLTCNEEYNFVSAPVISYIDLTGYEDTSEFEKINNHEYQLTLYLESDAIIDAVASITKNYLSINTPTNVNITITDVNGFKVQNDSLYAGNTYNIVVKPDKDYTLEESTISFTGDGNTATEVELNNGVGTFTPYSNIVTSVSLGSVNRTQWNINNKLANGTVENSILYSDVESVLILNANDGYYFKDIPNVHYLKNGYPEYITGVRISKVKIEYSLPIYNNPRTVDGSTILYVKGEAVQDTDVANKYGIIKVYNPTTEELQELSKVRYDYYADDNVNTVDLGNYISKLFKLYCDVNTVGTGEITLSKYNTGITSAVVSDYEITVDCGSVTINEHYENSLDYKDTIINIFIPFVGDKELDTVRVMNEKIRLIYKVNVITGDCIAFINNTSGDSLYRYKGNMSFSIPYKFVGIDSYYENQINDTDLSLMGFTPTVYIRRKKATNYTNTIQNNYKRDIIANFNGYHEFDDFFIDNSYIVDDEKQELYDLLKGGVIV